MVPVNFTPVTFSTVIWCVIVLLVIMLMLYGVLIYNRLVGLKHQVRQSWSNIDVLLKQRHDELPKLVAACKEYMKHEQTTLEKVIQARQRVADARSSGNINALGAAEGMLRAGIGELFALVENYPELKANENFQHLQRRITQLEETIADRREYYNATVNNNNVQIEVFPDVLIARFFKFKSLPPLQFRHHEKTDINVHALFQNN